MWSWSHNKQSQLHLLIYTDYREPQTEMWYLQTAVAHAEAHSIHVDMVRQHRPRCFAIVLRKLLHKWRWSALIFVDCGREKKTKSLNVLCTYVVCTTGIIKLTWHIDYDFLSSSVSYISGKSAEKQT